MHPIKSLHILILLSLSLIFNISDIYSQPYLIWAKGYNGPSNNQDSAVGIAVNANGNLFITGWSTGTLGSDIVTIRYNPDTGDTIWVKRYTGTGVLEDKPSAISCDNDYVYVTGWTFQPGRDIITIKYSAATGDTIWTRKYNGSGAGGDYGFAITQDVSGNVYVTGRSDVGGTQKFTTLKYDPSGNVLWANVYSGGVSGIFDQANAIKLDGSNDVYVTGFSRSGGSGTDDYLTMKINGSAGSVVWAKKYNGSQNNSDLAYALVLDGAGSNVFVTGYSFRTGGVQDIVTIKYSTSTGDSVAAAVYNGPTANIDIGTAIIRDPSDNIYVAGSSFGTSGYYDYITIKYNSGLAQQWVARTAGPAGNNFVSAMAYESSSSSVIVTGSSAGTGTGTDYLTVSYNASTGSMNWSDRINGGSSGNDYATGIAISDNEHIFITGSANFTAPDGTNCYTIRYSIVSGIEPIGGIVPQSYSLSQNYPNPFNPTTSIRFDLPMSSYVSLIIYDILGRTVDILAEGKFNTGAYLVNWDATRYSSGIYFYTLVTDEYVATKKMILSR